MVKTSILFENIKTAIENLSWTSVDGGGTTSFSGVFTYPNWAHDLGNPFVCILDASSNFEIADTSSTLGSIVIEFHVCSDYTTNGGTNESSKREEAMLRLREGSDELRSYLASDTTINTFLTTPTVAYTGNIGSYFRKGFVNIEPQYDEESNLFKRVITLEINEQILIS